MLTLKLISEETERVIAGLEKKHFKGAREAIENVLAVDKRRREAQRELDNTKMHAKQMAAQIGNLMKQLHYILPHRNCLHYYNSRWNLLLGLH